MSSCNLCPRKCNVSRKNSLQTYGEVGFCQMGNDPVVARAAIHMWEEPCISGANGSGAVFFSGCSLKCCYCQNYEISVENYGKEISVERLKEIYEELIDQGVHNINLVSPTHFTDAISLSLQKPLSVPVIYNCSGYESVESLSKLKGKIQIYLPDLKYSDNICAERYSHAHNYFSIATKAIKTMYEQIGDYEIDKNGILKKGVLIRHLVLPNNLENSYGVIDWIADTFKEGQVLFSLMGQYIPHGNLKSYPEINRKLTDKEYYKVEQYLFKKDINDGYVQETDAADDSFIPDFHLQGI